MRNLPIFPALVLGCFAFACGPKPPPPPNEYIKLNYTLSTGWQSGDEPLVMAIPDGSLPCGRAEKTIKVSAARNRFKVDINLSGPGTMPAELQASSITNGRVNVDVIVPAGPPDSMTKDTMSFSTADPANTFTCLLKVKGPDPFSTFDAILSCDSRQNPNGRLLISDTEIRATMCSPI